MKKVLFSVAVAALALTLAVSAIPTSAEEAKAEDAKSTPEYTEMLGIADFPKDLDLTKDENNKDSQKYFDVGEDLFQLAKDGKMNQSLVDIDGKRWIEFDAQSIPEGKYVQSDVITALTGPKDKTLALGRRAKEGAESLIIPIDATDYSEPSPYVSFVIWEYAKNDQGKGFIDTAGTSFSIAFWRIAPESKYKLIDEDGNEQEVSLNKEKGDVNISFPQGFKGYIVVDMKDIELTWGSADYNKQKNCTTFSGDNILKTTIVTSLYPNRGQLRVGGFYLGYNGYKPGMADAKEVKMMDGKSPKEVCDNKDFDGTVDTDDSKAEDNKTPVANDEQSKAPEKKTDSTSVAPSTTSKATTTTQKQKSPVTGDTSVGALVAILLVSAGAAVVVSKKR